MLKKNLARSEAAFLLKDQRQGQTTQAEKDRRDLEKEVDELRRQLERQSWRGSGQPRNNPSRGPGESHPNYNNNYNRGNFGRTDYNRDSFGQSNRGRGAPPPPVLQAPAGNPTAEDRPVCCRCNRQGQFARNCPGN